MRVLVLGDSSSAGIGPGLEIYPYQLFRRLEASGSIELQNHSSPGLTSADAARYFTIKLSEERWDAIVVYLGNNEGGPTGHKGRYLPDSDRLGLGARRSERTIPALPAAPRDFPLSPNDPPTHGPATTPRELSENLSAIATLARTRGTLVVLVNPIANRAYPASAGPWLSPFFKIIGAPWRIGHLVAPAGNAATRIRKALCAQERGWHARAVHEYEAVLSEGCESASLKQLASNNLAVVLHDAGRASDAEAILMSEADTGHACSAIASYNLAKLLEHQGRTEAEAWLDLALEQDASLYRVKTAYREAIARLGASSDVQVLDLAKVLPADAFVDYCHPTAAGHATIAAALQPLLRMPHTASWDADARVCRYERHFPSPNAFYHCDDSLLDYYDIAPPVSTQDLAEDMSHVTRTLQTARMDRFVDALRLVNPDSVVQYAITRALTHVATHPLITSIDDVCRWPLRYACEVGRLPEHYVYRVLIAYLKWASAHGISTRLGEEDVDHEPSALCASYRQLLIGRTDEDTATPVNVSDDYRERLRRRVLDACQDDRLFQDLRAERLVTVLRWYTREAFRYGTQSRISMLYPRPSFDSILEALRVWMLLARFLDNRDDERLIQALYAWLRGLERLHIDQAQRFVRLAYSSSVAETRRFRRALLRWRARLPPEAASSAT